MTLITLPNVVYIYSGNLIKITNIQTVHQFKHDNVVHTLAEFICNAFANYYEDLYTPADMSTVDDSTLNEIEKKTYSEIKRR